MQVKITDAAAFSNINKPKTLETFGQYCSEEISWKVRQQLLDLKRLGFVFCTYRTDCIKGQLREGQEIGVRISVRKEIPIAKKFQAFLKNSGNKKGLFKMLAINITKIPANIVEIMATHLGEFLSALEPCNHEKANMHLLFHACEASKNGFKRLLIVIVCWFCVTFSTWISRSCGSRLVPERIGRGFSFIHMREHCIRRYAKHCPFGAL